MAESLQSALLWSYIYIGGAHQGLGGAKPPPKFSMKFVDVY